MTSRYVISIFLITSLLMTCSPKPSDTSAFVKVQGTRFVIDGKSYRFLGANLWYGANLAIFGPSGDRDRLVRELDQLTALGINNLRILGASEGFSKFNTIDPPSQPELGKYDERVLDGLDFLLAEMGKRGMVAVIFLNNYWVWSGGMAQYISWIENEQVPNPFMEQYSWDDFMKFSARFYSHKGANAYYRNYIRMLVDRTNRYTNRKYRDDPTIMAWQLANEPRPGAGDWGIDNFDCFAQWIDSTARFIKSIDPNHLVSTGNEGLGGTIWSQELCERINQFENIDYMTVHLWVLNWSWFDPLNAVETYPDAEQKALEYVQQHVDMAQKLNKPLVLEEFGIPRDDHSFNPAMTTIYRDRYFRKIFEAIYTNSEKGGPLVGSNFWSWAGEGRPHDPVLAQWQSGDPFTGDPPQEPQGRNSIFDCDDSTLSVIREYAQKMKNR